MGLLCGGAAAIGMMVFEPKTDDDMLVAFGATFGAMLALWMFGKLVRATARGLFRARPAEPSAKRLPPVRVALRVPRASTPIAQVPGVLPDYCLAAMFPPTLIAASEGQAAPPREAPATADGIAQGLAVVPLRHWLTRRRVSR